VRRGCHHGGTDGCCDPWLQFSELEAQWLHKQAGAFRDEIEDAVLATLTAALNRKLAAGMVVVVPEPAMAGDDNERVYLAREYDCNGPSCKVSYAQRPGFPAAAAVASTNPMPVNYAAAQRYMVVAAGANQPVASPDPVDVATLLGHRRGAAGAMSAFVADKYRAFARPMTVSAGVSLAASREKRALEGGDSGAPRVWERDTALKSDAQLVSELEHTVKATAVALVTAPPPLPAALVVAQPPWSAGTYVERVVAGTRQCSIYTTHTATAGEHPDDPATWALAPGEFAVWHVNDAWHSLLPAVNVAMNPSVTLTDVSTVEALGNLYVIRVAGDTLWGLDGYTRRGTASATDDVFIGPDGATVTVTRTFAAGVRPTVTVVGDDTVVDWMATLAALDVSRDAKNEFLSAAPFASADATARAFAANVWSAFVNASPGVALEPEMTVTPVSGVSAAAAAEVVHVETCATQWCIGNSPVMAADALLNITAAISAAEDR